MDAIKQAFAFFIRAVGFGLAALLVAGAVIWITSYWTDSKVHIQNARASAAEASIIPFHAVNAGIIWKAQPDPGGLTETMEGVWIVNGKTGAVRLCGSSVNPNAVISSANCGMDSDGQ